ncbi:hypothetical protein QR680_001799 [Steinernema hermaphroditum]|uniref:Uncharacterized protein n=1 Tax=Steinernema hermaphroditum TaxID=289476 RepID=A0AA39GZX8_9BILA|nr:hypothetical protein QR680_001799 [Steinernema hermaphroditum]
MNSLKYAKILYLAICLVVGRSNRERQTAANLLFSTVFNFQLNSHIYPILSTIRFGWCHTKERQPPSIVTATRFRTEQFHCLRKL